MGRQSFNRKIHDICARGSSKYPVKYEHHYTSSKYGKYVYNVSINGINLWQAVLQDMPIGTGWTWHYYADTEDRCAKEVFKQFSRYLRRLTKINKLLGGHFNRHKIWQAWIDNYKSNNKQL